MGASDTASGDSHAYYWRRGRLIDLGTLDGGDSRAVAVNDRGQVVGTSEVSGEPRRAFLWQDGRMIDLSAIAGAGPDATRPTDVYDVNDRGQIIGRTWDPATGRERILLWTVRSP